MFEDEGVAEEVLTTLTHGLTVVPNSSEFFTDISHFSVVPIMYHIGTGGVKQVLSTLLDGVPF